MYSPSTVVELGGGGGEVIGGGGETAPTLMDSVLPNLEGIELPSLEGFEGLDNLMEGEGEGHAEEREGEREGEEGTSPAAVAVEAPSPGVSGIIAGELPHFGRGGDDNETVLDPNLLDLIRCRNTPVVDEGLAGGGDDGVSRFPVSFESRFGMVLVVEITGDPDALPPTSTIPDFSPPYPLSILPLLSLLPVVCESMVLFALLRTLPPDLRSFGLVTLFCSAVEELPPNGVADEEDPAGVDDDDDGLMLLKHFEMAFCPI
ncbi:hypothetical protein DFH27DRAFT_600052 [Peziza echinospora]|nr:hypothetical protein DFH27DRAFT_600052 [Peziza echinospora]